jgi:dTDP-4-dehydrorhamnose 3,5-epimerase
VKAIETPLNDVFVLTPEVHHDERGYFLESFNADRFAKLTGFAGEFVQDNESFSRGGVLRGLHCQSAPFAQGKLLRVVQGAVWDVVLDIRPSSSTFGAWLGLELSGENRKQLWVPPGLAHGFVTLSDTAFLQYKVTEYWSPAHEYCIAWNDSDLAIDWHYEGTPIVSEKDAAGVAWVHFLSGQL